jgi:hypothetical protein
MKIYQKKTKKNKIMQWIELKLLQFYCIIGIISILVLSLYAFYSGIKFLLQPKTVVIYNYTVKEESKEEVKNEKKQLNIDEVVRRIMGLESSFGKNNYSKCAAIGQYNRYGYGIPGNGKYLCFELDKDTEAVKSWIKERKDKYSLGSLLCGYNMGFKNKLENCDYYNRFLNMEGGVLYE